MKKIGLGAPPNKGAAHDDLTRKKIVIIFILIFQIGRSSESPIDFVVMDTVPGNKATEKINTQSTISRFACRLLCIRDDTDLSAMIFAAGFDSSRNIFQGEFSRENNKIRMKNDFKFR